MNLKISLQEALNTWVSYQVESTAFSRHLTVGEFDTLDLPISMEKRKRIISHLILCKDCSQKLKIKFREELKEGVEYWDTALRKAAATGKKEYPIFITTQNGNYKLEIRESESQPNSGIIILYVQDNLKAELEGKTVSVVDSKGRTLLRGIIKQGELFQMIDDLKNIDDSNILVRPIN